jgi:hypothetical protein
MKASLYCALPAGFVLFLRAALLPVWPFPVPYIYDEFSYILQADTFAHGRLANPTHPMWPFFETIYVLQKPACASKYPPGQALAMAAGQRLLGHPWFGVWLSCGILMAALCWAMQAWLPGRCWLLGAAIALQLCFFSYWMNSYWGGAVAAAAGALVIGAYGRIARRGAPGFAWVLGAGAVVLMLTRPYEGLLLVTPVLAMLAARNRRKQVWLPILIVGLAGAAWLGFYNYRITGNPWRLPYQEYVSQYETTRTFSVLPAAPPGSITFRHFDHEWLDRGWALKTYQAARSWRIFFNRLQDWYQTLSQILGCPLWIVPLLGFAPRLFRSPRTRFLAWLLAIMLAGSMIEVPWYSHYPAPFLVVILILTVEALRYVRPLVPAIAIVVFTFLLWKDGSRIYRQTTPDRYVAANGHRGDIERRLTGGDTSPDRARHVIFVRYTGVQTPHEEWIYNSADIDSQAVIWAQDMGDDENRRLIRYFAGRKFWRFQPDESPDTLTPYE